VAIGGWDWSIARALKTMTCEPTSFICSEQACVPFMGIGRLSQGTTGDFTADAVEGPQKPVNVLEIKAGNGRRGWRETVP
jgi:hypothetical protein